MIFDGGLPGGPSRDLSTPSVRVVFAHGGTTADLIIMERLRKVRDSGSVIVVSADREIVNAAARRRIRVITPCQFATELETPSLPTNENDPNPHLTPKEIDEWLSLFGSDPDTA